MNTDVLFRPFSHPKLSLRNRIVMPPMTRGFCPNGVPGDNVVEYYRRRAAGGVGLIVSEGTTVNHPAASDNVNYPHFWGDAALAGWQKVIEAVHVEGAKMVPQLWHLGPMRRQGSGPVPDAPSASPSGLIAPEKKKYEPLHAEEIQAIVNAFAESAVLAKELGFDGVELHGAHSYLIDSFFWEGTNVRQDEFGGDMERRNRFAVEIVREVRRRCGEDFPIILRFSQWKQQNYDAKLATNPDELQRFLMPLAQAGVDIFHCSTRRFWQPEFEGSNLNLAGWTKKLTGKATISVGSVSLNEEFITTYRSGSAGVASIDDLLERVAAEEFDLIAVGRAQIANPDWSNLVRAGRLADLKPYSKDLLGQLM